PAQIHRRAEALLGLGPMAHPEIAAPRCALAIRAEKQDLTAGGKKRGTLIGGGVHGRAEVRRRAERIRTALALAHPQVAAAASLTAGALRTVNERQPIGRKRRIGIIPGTV